MSSTAPTRPSDTALFARILSNARGKMSPELARYILTLGFGDDDQKRMQDLAERNQQGALSPEGHEELLSYVRAGHLLALLHSQARRSLKKKLA